MSIVPNSCVWFFSFSENTHLFSINIGLNSDEIYTLLFTHRQQTFQFLRSCASNLLELGLLHHISNIFLVQESPWRRFLQHFFKHWKLYCLFLNTLRIAFCLTTGLGSVKLYYIKRAIENFYPYVAAVKKIITLTCS